MPKLTYEIPESKWAKLVAHAKREGVSVRAMVLWDLRETLARAECITPPPADTSTEQVAA